MVLFLRRVGNVINRINQGGVFFQPGSRLIFTRGTAHNSIKIDSQGQRKKNQKTSVHIINSHIVKSPGPDIDIPLVPLDEFVWGNVSNWPNKIALECGLTGRKYTFEEAKILTHKFAQAMNELGLNRNDVVGVLSPNIPEVPMVVLGATRAGLGVTLVNPIYSESEISFQLIASDTKAIVTTKSMYTKAKIASSKCPTIQNIIVIGDSEDTPDNDDDCILFDRLIRIHKNVEYKGMGAEMGFDPRRHVAVLPYTSGTSAVPKGVMLTHTNLIANIIAMGHPEWSSGRVATETHQECFVIAVPLSHIYGLNAVLLTGLTYGVKIVTLPKFDPRFYLRALAQHKPTVLHMIPAFMNFLLETRAIENKMCDRVHTVICGGSPPGAFLTGKMLNRFKDIGVNVSYQEGYGMTETSPLITLLKPCTLENKKLLGSCGKPIPGTECVIVKNGVSVGKGESGELYARGPQLMKGYYNSPETTDQVFDGDWIRTRDAAKFNEDGYLYLLERLKDLIQVAGQPVSPTEIENRLKSHPNIADVAVCGIPDSIHGEVAKAFVVLKDPSFTKEEDIVAFLKDRLPDFKQLMGGAEFIDEIPRNANGKIIRKILKKLCKAYAAD